jgi:hypothetical protein
VSRSPVGGRCPPHGRLPWVLSLDVIKHKLKASAPSLTPWQLLDQFARIQFVEVWFKLRTDGCICLERITQPGLPRPPLSTSLTAATAATARHGQSRSIAVGAFSRQRLRCRKEVLRLLRKCRSDSQTATVCRMVWSNGDGPRFCGWTIGLLERNRQSFNS